MKRKAKKDLLGTVFLETQGIYKRRRFNPTLEYQEESGDMDVITQHIEEVREMYAGNTQEFIQDLHEIRTEAQKAPNLFSTEKEFWDFLFQLIGRTRYPLITYKAQCCSCFEKTVTQADTTLKVPFCSSECQSSFYDLFFK